MNLGAILHVAEAVRRGVSVETVLREEREKSGSAFKPRVQNSAAILPGTMGRDELDDLIKVEKENGTFRVSGERSRG